MWTEIKINFALFKSLRNLEKFGEKFKATGNRVNTFAEFQRITNLLFEARRKEFYVKDPCDEYAMWVQLPSEVQRTAFSPV